jgi:uncharacterized protein YkwD
MNKLLHTVWPMALVLTLLSCSNDETIEDVPAAKGNSTLPVQNYTYTSDELQLADAVNDYRESIGLNPLETINYVSLKSEEHTEYMIANHVLNHDNFEQRSQEIIAVLGASKVSENVAYNYSTAASVLHAWLESPGHKANIEGDFTHFGFSIRIDPETNKKYYTNIFIKK